MIRITNNKNAEVNLAIIDGSDTSKLDINIINKPHSRTNVVAGVKQKSDGQSAITNITNNDKLYLTYGEKL